MTTQKNDPNLNWAMYNPDKANPKASAPETRTHSPLSPGPLERRIIELEANVEYWKRAFNQADVTRLEAEAYANKLAEAPPESFTVSLSDFATGRVVDMDTALTKPPPSPRNWHDKYCALKAQADKLAEALRDTELRTTQARIASGIGRKKDRTEFLLGELERIAGAASKALAEYEAAQ